jgi:signal transduction histidine kinase
MSTQRPLTVLNVNDREGARYLITQMLRREGFQVVEAASGTEALALAPTMPDLVVLDVRLPDLDGHEVCRRLKASAATAVIPVLETSAAAVRTEDRVLGLESGADAYLVQPFEAQELVATARALIRMRAAERQAKEALALREAALLEREQFLGTASHELRTPVTSLLLRLESLHRAVALGQATPEKTAQRVEAALRSTRYLRNLIHRFLAQSRMREGVVELVPARTDLRGVVQDALETFEMDFSSAGCAVQLQAPAPVEGMWDAVGLEQVASNLLHNAVKYAPGKPVHVSVTSDPERGLARLIVQDEGAGIAAEDHQRIFRRFERSSGASTAQPSFGLGLWIVRQIVDASGGTIRVQSQPGQGAAFIVELPLGLPRQGEGSGEGGGTPGPVTSTAS